MMQPLELWGGPECTVNRVGDKFVDQFERSGHDRRSEDHAHFATLGLTALRYPLSWERVAPDRPDRRDWDWTRCRLERIRAAGQRVIAGLIHHGSGPRYTNLLDPAFPGLFADYAAAAAREFPWINDWTPVNEPVTTARFSALYGHWYPHLRDERAFWLALLNQVEGTRLAMRAIRRVNPAARLIQTDDLGRTFATAALRDQAGFDNLRRWSGWDLLCGRIVPGHGLWQRLAEFGLSDRLASLASAPCIPDVIGVNHYLTSDRFLDHRQQRYPGCPGGGNGARTYVDVEAVRVLQPPPAGLAGALRDAWQRYGLPIAITEVHNGCTREEQMRWMAQAWDTAVALRGEGIAIEAVTCWALVGSAGWSTLLTGAGEYEPGPFDVGGPSPRRTALADLTAGLPRGADRHPVVRGAGWWSRPIRLLHPAVPRPAPMREHRRADPQSAPPLLICGATGTLGKALGRACRHRAITHVLTSREELDLDNEAQIAAVLDRHRPWAVVNATGWVKVDEAERRSEACHQINAKGASALAAACARRDIPTASFSSDLVFGGAGDAPYAEGDAPAPVNVYGRSKVAMEEAIQVLPGTHLIVRPAAFFSPYDSHNFAHAVAETLSRRLSFRAADDQVVTPSYVPLLVDRTLDLVIDGERGIWHLSGEDAVCWAEFACRVARACGLSERLVVPVSGDSLGLSAPRPASTALTSTRGASLGSLDDALERFARNRREPVAQV